MSTHVTSPETVAIRRGGVEYFLVSFSGVYLFSGVEMFVSFRECKWDVFFKWMFMRILVGRSSKQCQ